MYAVTIEPDCALMNIRIEGFWSRAVMKSYIAELQRTAEAMAKMGGCKRILVNMSEYPIQAQEIVKGHANIIDHARQEMKARVAVVMTSSLSRLQAKRMAILGGHEMFDDEPSARAWLTVDQADHGLAPRCDERQASANA